MLTAPVVLIAFNRPELTRQTLASIRAAQPTRLYLVVDGPRTDRPEDEELCAAVRAELQEIDWPCEVDQRFSETNLGCEANVELGLDWVFSHEAEAIILEDDCIPDATFFPFAQELLDRYRDDERVWHIAGNSHWVDAASFDGKSYDFSTWASVWGWATWRDAWQRHRAAFPRDHQESSGSWDTAAAVRTHDAMPAPGSLCTASGRRHFEAVARSYDGSAYGWDSHWWVSIMANGGLSATPAVNLVANDGFGVGATHTRSNRQVTPAEPMPFPLIHPDTVRLNEDVERELELVLLRANGRLARAARSVIRPMWIRSIIRATMSNRLVWRTVKVVTALSALIQRQLVRSGKAG
jgi:hypothetical protein